MYELPHLTDPLTQGDVIDACPVLAIDHAEPIDLDAPATRWRARIIVLTQACDLAQAKTTRVLVGLVHPAAEIVAAGLLSESMIRDRVRRSQVFGWYFLPASKSPFAISESIVDLRDLHTVHRSVLEHLIASQQRVGRLVTPYREHLAQHFANTYSRIGLPEPYETEP